jgi:hypothetical protein
MPALSARITFIKEEYRVYKTNDAAALTAFPSSDIFKISTFFNNEADATTLGTTLLALRKADRGNWYAVLSDRYRFVLQVGKTYTIIHPRFGLSAGKNFIVKGVRESSNSRTIEVSLFGPQ